MLTNNKMYSNVILYSKYIVKISLSNKKILIGRRLAVCLWKTVRQTGKAFPFSKTETWEGKAEKK